MDSRTDDVCRGGTDESSAQVDRDRRTTQSNDRSDCISRDSTTFQGPQDNTYSTSGHEDRRARRPPAEAKIGPYRQTLSTVAPGVEHPRRDRRRTNEASRAGVDTTRVERPTVLKNGKNGQKCGCQGGRNGLRRTRHEDEAVAIK
ncbi:unnamed protein product [Protopolystoma xenopodis]|uniref:Uncharacterized protein n=1 Tax=Protopolystoma xenopodis TaxID=117903 RepID=A0A3S4ZU95_9PLAT|nr:unnamed protein product [Protopolystoma xenopodis]